MAAGFRKGPERDLSQEPGQGDKGTQNLVGTSRETSQLPGLEGDDANRTSVNELNSSEIAEAIEAERMRLKDTVDTSRGNETAPLPGLEGGQGNKTSVDALPIGEILAGVRQRQEEELRNNQLASNPGNTVSERPSQPSASTPAAPSNQPNLPSNVASKQSETVETFDRSSVKIRCGSEEHTLNAQNRSVEFTVLSGPLILDNVSIDFGYAKSDIDKKIQLSDGKIVGVKVIANEYSEHHVTFQVKVDYLGKAKKSFGEYVSAFFALLGKVLKRA